MGAGDVKLMAGIGAWMGWQITLAAFAVSAVIGAMMAVSLVNDGPVTLIIDSRLRE